MRVFIDRRAVARDCHGADQILKTLIESEWIAFEIEKKIAGRR